MGDGARRKLEFERAHPRCCYCCGLGATATIDHSPARSFFPKHGAPKGFRFPACAKCNAAKKDDESRFSLIAGMLNVYDPHDEDHRNAIMRRAEAHLRRDPELVREIAASKEPGESGLPHPTMQLPQTFHEGVVRMGLWFALSLFYRVRQRPCSSDTKVGVKFLPNGSLLEPPAPLAEILSNLIVETPQSEAISVHPRFSWGHRLFDDGRGVIVTEIHGCVLWLANLDPIGQSQERLPEANWFSCEAGSWVSNGPIK